MIYLRERMLPVLVYNYGFDPTHGYTEKRLVVVEFPKPVEGFEEFWTEKYRSGSKGSELSFSLDDTGKNCGDWRVFDIKYQSTNNFTVKGWLLLPINTSPKRGFIVTHGYGGRDAPDFYDYPFPTQL